MTQSGQGLLIEETRRVTLSRKRAHHQLRELLYFRQTFTSPQTRCTIQRVGKPLFGGLARAAMFVA